MKSRPMKRLTKGCLWLLLALPSAQSQGGTSMLYDVLGHVDASVRTVSEAPSEAPTQKNWSKPNLLYIVADQLRWDVLEFVQVGLSQYSGKLKINTPNIDRLASMGVIFDTTYCESPMCVPSRGTLKTGCTVKRTGLTTNQMMSGYQIMESNRERVESLQTFEQLLVERLGYRAEYYGKWHLPTALYLGLENKDPVISYDYYDFETDSFSFTGVTSFSPCYKANLDYLLTRDNVQTRTGPVTNSWSGRGYDPIRLDPSNNNGIEEPMGRDSLSSNYTVASILGQVALKALDRLVYTSQPFILSVHFNTPHPPYISTGAFMDKYYNDRDQLFISPSISDPMSDSAYNESFVRKFPSNGYNNESNIAEFVAAYYGLVEEVDYWVGQLLDKLEHSGLWNNTMVIVTSDHGEMLGAHAMSGKGVLLEEATRVPLIVSLPQGQNSGTRVTVPVSQLDLFSTVMDYLGAPASLDKSDGKSLRRFIEQTSYNANYDETAVVSEFDDRAPKSSTVLRGTLGDVPNYMIRKGSFKLILPRAAESPVIDMMYDLSRDPYEVNNLLESPSAAVVGKAEHLKALLLEWMQRHDGVQGFFSDPKYNNNEGRGDIIEVKARRTWKSLPLWISDSTIYFDTPAKLSTGYIRKEYLYLGRTTSGTLTISSISVKGASKNYFKVKRTGSSIGENGYIRVAVTFRSSQFVAMNSIQAFLDIRTSEGEQIVELRG